MKKTYLGLMGLFLLPQTALAVDAAAPASTSVSSPLAALWRVLLTPITVPHLPWQLPLLAPVAMVLVLLLYVINMGVAEVLQATGNVLLPGLWMAL